MQWPGSKASLHGGGAMLCNSLVARLACMVVGLCHAMAWEQG